MTCAYCATPLVGNARFCGACGRPVPDEAPAVAFDQTLAANQDVRALSHEGVADAVPARRRADSDAETIYGQRSPLLEPSSPGNLPGTVPVDDPYVGTTLKGRFDIHTKLGEGGFGSVYGGIQSGTGRRVAIKMLHPEMTRDSNVVARFRREGQVLCNLRDAHSITTYDFDQTDDGTLFIAMELLEGRSLHDVFHSEAPIEWTRMVKIISECCSSLAEAHAQGIIHRDLKPENIHLEKRPGNPEFVKILDFGIAKVLHGDGSSQKDQPQLTATGQTLGTLEYMSPEQLMGKQLDGRSDIYGLGVVAYELLTGQLPFPDATGPAALIAAQLRKTPPSPSAINQRLPATIDRLILKMLEKAAADRFRDVSELRRACDDLFNAERSGGVGAYAPGQTPQPAPQQPAMQQSAMQQSRPPMAGPSQPPGPMYAGSSPPGQMVGPSGPYSSPSHSHMPARPMGPDTRAEVLATRRSSKVWIIIGALVFAGLLATGIILAVMN